MVDAVTVEDIYSGQRRKVRHITNISDGTGESAVTKIDISTYTFGGQAPDHSFAPVYTTIEMVDFAIQGFASVRLLWDHTTDDEIVVLPAGVGTVYFQAIGGKTDPRSAGGTGDVLLTTNGGASGSTYDIAIYWRGHP